MSKIDLASKDDVENICAEAAKNMEAFLATKGLRAKVIVKGFLPSQDEFDLRLNITRRYALNREAMAYNQWARDRGFLPSGQFFEVATDNGDKKVVTVVSLSESHDSVILEDEDEQRIEVPIAALERYGQTHQKLRVLIDPREQKRQTRETEAVVRAVTNVAPDSDLTGTKSSTIDLSF